MRRESAHEDFSPEKTTEKIRVVVAWFHLGTTFITEPPSGHESLPKKVSNHTRSLLLPG